MDSEIEIYTEDGARTEILRIILVTVGLLVGFGLLGLLVYWVLV